MTPHVPGQRTGAKWKAARWWTTAARWPRDEKRGMPPTELMLSRISTSSLLPSSITRFLYFAHKAINSEDE